MLLPHKSTEIDDKVYDTRKATFLAEDVVINRVTVPRGLTHSTNVDQPVYSQLFRAYDGVFLLRTAKRDANGRVYDDGLFTIRQAPAEVLFHMHDQNVGYARAFQWGNRRRWLADRWDVFRDWLRDLNTNHPSAKWITGGGATALAVVRQFVTHVI